MPSMCRSMMAWRPLAERRKAQSSWLSMKRSSVRTAGQSVFILKPLFRHNEILYIFVTTSLKTIVSFSMRFTIYPCKFSHQAKVTSLEEIVRAIRTSERLKKITEQIRQYHREGNTFRSSMTKHECLPVFVPAARINGERRIKSIVYLSCICYLDFDKISLSEVEVAMKKLKTCKNVLLAARSASGKGIHVLIPYRFAEGLDLGYLRHPGRFAKLYRKIFRQIAGKYAEMFGHPVDPTSSNPILCCIIAYDPDAYYNPNAEPIMIASL